MAVARMMDATRGHSGVAVHRSARAQKAMGGLLSWRGALLLWALASIGGWVIIFGAVSIYG